MVYSVRMQQEHISRPMATVSKEAAIAAAKQLGDGASVVAYGNRKTQMLIGKVVDGQWHPVQH